MVLTRPLLSRDNACVGGCAKGCEAQRGRTSRGAVTKGVPFPFLSVRPCSHSSFWTLVNKARGISREVGEGVEKWRVEQDLIFTLPIIL